MIYLNLKVSTLRSPAYIGSEPTARATWLSLLCYCCEQENGGIIQGCLLWKDRQWQQTCGVTLAEVKEASPLWDWLEDSLSVMFYPLDKEAEVQAKREAGRRGGKRSGESRRDAAVDALIEAPREAELQAELQGVLQADLERKGKERKISKGKKVEKDVAEVSATADKEWIDELAKNPAYTGINIEVELGKMQAWCAANKRQPSRRRFVNWLNRAEKPIAINGVSAPTRAKPSTVWEMRESLKAIKERASKLKGNPDNTEPINAETPWDRRLKPEVAEQLKQLKQREQELITQLAMVGQEPVMRVRL
jgi:hypothetical protein